jgi:hypothetical protein
MSRLYIFVIQITVLNMTFKVERTVFLAPDARTITTATSLSATTFDSSTALSTCRHSTFNSIMVKNYGSSLRSSASSFSLRTTAQEQNASSRIAELEAQLAAANARFDKYEAQHEAAVATIQPEPESSTQKAHGDVDSRRTLYEEAERFYGDNFSRYDWKPHNRVLHQEEESQTLFAEFTARTKQRAANVIASPAGTSGSDAKEQDDEHLLKTPAQYTQPFCDFIGNNPTVWHAVTYFEKKLEKAGFKKVCEVEADMFY